MRDRHKHKNRHPYPEWVWIITTNHLNEWMNECRFEFQQTKIVVIFVEGVGWPQFHQTIVMFAQNNNGGWWAGWTEERWTHPGTHSVSPPSTRRAATSARYSNIESTLFHPCLSSSEFYVSGRPNTQTERDMYTHTKVDQLSLAVCLCRPVFYPFSF